MSHPCGGLHRSVLGFEIAAVQAPTTFCSVLGAGLLALVVASWSGHHVGKS